MINDYINNDDNVDLQTMKYSSPWRSNTHSPPCAWNTTASLPELTMPLRPSSTALFSILKISRRVFGSRAISEVAFSTYVQGNKNVIFSTMSKDISLFTCLYMKAFPNKNNRCWRWTFHKKGKEENQRRIIRCGKQSKVDSWSPAADLQGASQ